MAIQDNQHKLGDLNTLQVPELKEILVRQERLANNKALLKCLPDGGKKIQAHVTLIREALKSHEKVDATADLFQRMVIDAEEARQDRIHYIEDEDDEDDPDKRLLGQIINREVSGKEVFDTRQEPKETKYLNSYDRVIRRATDPEARRKHGDKYLPNRTIHTTHIQDIPVEMLARLKTMKPTESSTTSSSPQVKDGELLTQTTSDNTANKNPSVGDPAKDTTSRATRFRGIPQNTDSKLRYLYDDSLEEKMITNPRKHEAAQMIDLEESATLLQQQKKLQEKLHAQQAMEKLAQRLHIKMAPFDPEGSRKMAYRVLDNDEEDSDDEEAGDVDYPEESST